MILKTHQHRSIDSSLKIFQALSSKAELPKLIGMRLFGSLSLFLICAGCTLAQDAVHGSTVTLGVGGAGQHDVGPVFKANYEYRWTRHLALEAGLDITLIPAVAYRLTYIQTVVQTVQPGVTYSSFSPTGQSFFTPFAATKVPVMIPFGAKGIVPLNGGRVELFGGLGAAYVFNSTSYGNNWMAQASIGARVSLDHEKRFWMGTTWRGFTNFQGSYPTGNNTFSGTADFGFRFGH